MSQWDGRLIFAGEGTIVEYEGSVHAALFSGKAESIHSHVTAYQERAEKTQDDDQNTNKESSFHLA
jgi:hypothetical protein